MNEKSQSLLKKICAEEIKKDCFNIQVDGYFIHGALAEMLRIKFLESKGFKQMTNRHGCSLKYIIRNFFLSLLSFVNLFFKKQSYDYFIYSFPRVEKIGDKYVDKFTDPIIDYTGLSKRKYIIFERSRGGIHYTPRTHNDHLIYTDAVDLVLNIISRIFFVLFYIIHKKDIDKYWCCLLCVYGEVVSKNVIKRLVLHKILYVKFYCYILKRLKIKKLISVSRNTFSVIMYASKELGIPVYELQHGITYAETTEYSGYRHPKYTPDKFLAFGNNSPNDVYGIDVDKIINIGWALNLYIEGIKDKRMQGVKSTDVLIISDPTITEEMLDVTCKLSQYYPDVCFYFRPHPMEIINDKHLEIIKSISNIKLQDRTVNICVVLHNFINVIGQNSTVLYEALSMGKKVGKLFMSGLSSDYLNEDDKKCFFEIHREEDLLLMMKSNCSDRKSKKIYSLFRPELFEQLM